VIARAEKEGAHGAVCSTLGRGQDCSEPIGSNGFLVVGEVNGCCGRMGGGNRTFIGSVRIRSPLFIAGQSQMILFVMLRALCSDGTGSIKLTKSTA
jgi:hypothetical protein